MEYKFTIKLKPITKKNSQQIVKDKTGRPRIVPSSAYKKYEKQCEKFMPDIETISGSDGYRAGVDTVLPTRQHKSEQSHIVPKRVSDRAGD